MPNDYLFRLDKFIKFKYYKLKDRANQLNTRNPCNISRIRYFQV